jgi:DNA-binding Lrp family transcriptional regulator
MRRNFRQLVNRVDDIQEAYSLTGDADYLLKAVLRDLKSLSDIVNNVLMPPPERGACALLDRARPAEGVRNAR